MRWMALALAAWLAIGVAHADWHEATTPHVRVLAEGSEKNARALAERIERFDAAMRVLRGLPASDSGPAGRLNIYVVRNAGAVAKLVSVRDVAGFYIPRAGGSVAFVPQQSSAGGELALGSQAVLFHEYAHHFMFRNFPGAYPAWFAEGYAEFHATASFERDGSVMFGRPPLYRAYGLVQGTQLPIETLLEPDPRRLSRLQVDNLYGRSWMLLHMLTFSKERQPQLARYIADIGKGSGSIDSARAAFGDLAVLNRELDKYVRQRLTGVTIPAARIQLPPIAVRQLSAAEEAMIDVHIESTSGVTREEALKLLPKARRAAAPHADDAFAQGVLAEAEFDAGNFAQARDAALRALAADPASRQGLVYHGMALAALADAAGDTSKATHRAIIAPWQTANRLDPDDPRPMALIYASTRQFGIDNPSVVKAIKYAQVLAPEDRGLRFTAAREYIREGDLDAARPLIASLAYDPHSGNREKMSALLATIDAADRPGTQQALEALGNDPAVEAEPVEPGG